MVRAQKKRHVERFKTPNELSSVIFILSLRLPSPPTTTSSAICIFFNNLKFWAAREAF